MPEASYWILDAGYKILDLYTDAVQFNSMKNYAF